MFRFLLTRRWISLLMAVCVVGFACVELGLWQFRRYHERHDTNLVTRDNLTADPVPVADVLDTSTPPTSDEQWRTGWATGHYDATHQLVVLYRTRDGAPGVDVVVPLVTASGSAVLVDRGWVATSGSGDLTPAVPPPPSGTVTVTGWVRISADGGSDQVTPADGSVRAISSDAIKPTLPYDTYDGFLDLTHESPGVRPAPAHAQPPDLGAGPSFFYGIQWFFFAVLAFGFWCYFAWSEYAQQHGRGGVTARVSSLRRPAA